MTGVPTAAFDAHADVYDQVAESPLGLTHRRRVREVLASVISGSARVLDIGCGTGIDAVWLADRGCQVTALDPAARMVARADQRAASAGHGTDGTGRVSVAVGDIDTLDHDKPGRGPFELVLANFGVINCCHDLHRFGDWLGRSLSPGGAAVLVTMTPFCPPELLQGAVTGNRALLGRRRTGQHPGYDGLTVHYHSAGRLAAALGPGVRLRDATALGVVLPTFEQRRLVSNRPRLLRSLAAADRAAGRAGARLGIGDHHLAVFERAGR